MTDDEPVGPLPLRDALLAWCDQGLLMEARQTQQAFTVLSMEAAGRPDLGQARRRDGRDMPYRPAAPDERTRLHEAAWTRLLRDWRERLQAGAIVMTGVQTEPEVSEKPERIAGIWATDFEFDFLNSALTGLGRRYVAVRASRGGTQATATGTAETGQPPPAATPWRPTLDDVRDLDPEVVAKLLELHADHVCKDLRVNLNPPGKASVLALAAVKMKHRAKLDQLRPTISEEAEWLSHWCAGVAPSYQPLGDKTIRNKLGSLYRDLRSKAHR